MFGWKGLRSDVKEFVKQCQVCQQAKPELIHSPGVLHPLPVPARVWIEITMDCIEGLPKSESYNAILMVVDGSVATVRLTKNRACLVATDSENPGCQKSGEQV